MRETEVTAVPVAIVIVCKTGYGADGIENSENIGLAAKRLRETAMLRSENGMHSPVKTCTDP